MKNLKAEQFESILRDKPESRAFAPLAEIYRKNGQLEKALETALKGVDFNPNYHSGRVALARVLVDLNQLSEAQTQLRTVVEKEPENILALRILGKVSIQLKDYKMAMEIYTKLKTIQPEDQKSEKILEGLKKSGFISESQEAASPPAGNYSLEKELAYIDALLDQSKYKKAELKINEALKNHSENADLKKRLYYIKGLAKTDGQIQKSSVTTPYAVNMKKIKTLNLALKNIEKRLNHDSNFGL